MKHSGIERAAMFLMAIEQDSAAKIIEMLEDDEIKEISQAMSSLGSIQTGFIEKLLTEYWNEMSANASIIGNVQNTERFLRQVLGKEKVDLILEDLRGPAGRNTWDKLSNVSEEMLANFLKNEYPQTSALILSKLPAAHASRVLTLMPDETSFEIVKRILSMDSIKKEVLESVEKTIRTEFLSNLSNTQKADNSEIMAEIFNAFDRTSEAKFMGFLEEYNKDAAESIKNLMFTFDDLVKVDATGIQLIMKTADKAKLTIALKGAKEDVRKLFIDNMSQRAAKILIEELEGMGPVKLKDVDEAQNSVILIAKDLIEKGEIEISDGDDSDLVY